MRSWHKVDVPEMSKKVKKRTKTLHETQALAEIDIYLNSASDAIQKAADLAEDAGVAFGTQMPFSQGALQFISSKVQAELEKLEEVDVYGATREIEELWGIMCFEDGWRNYGGGWMSS